MPAHHNRSAHTLELTLRTRDAPTMRSPCTAASEWPSLSTTGESLCTAMKTRVAKNLKIKTLKNTYLYIIHILSTN